MFKNVSSTKIVPISEDTRKRENRWMALVDIVCFLVAIGSMYSLRTNTVSLSNVHFLGGLSGVLAIVIFIILIGSDDDVEPSSRRFNDAFGISPYGKPDKVQTMINCILMSMWQSYDGHVQREIGAERDHMSTMSAKSAAHLLKMRNERNGADGPIKNAANLAIDWRYTVPEEIKQFIK